MRIRNLCQNRKSQCILGILEIIDCFISFIIAMSSKIDAYRRFVGLNLLKAGCIMPLKYKKTMP